MEPWAILLTLIVIFLAVYYFYYRENEFEKRGIFHRKSIPLLGTLGEAFIRRISPFELLHEIYNLNDDAKYVGFFGFEGKSAIMLRDLELIQSVTVKNFDHFVNHVPLADPNLVPLIKSSLMLLEDDKWREVRSVLSPAFTASKMRAMFKLMSQCAAEFADCLVPRSQEKASDIASKDAFTRYTNDVIATCAFGVAVNSMQDRDNKFYKCAQRAANFQGIRILKFFLMRSSPKLFKLLRMRLFDSDIEQFFTELVRDMIAMRTERGITRPDMIQLMMESKNEHGPKLTIEEMVSQAFIFFLAGYEPTSRAMCYVSHEIAASPDIQRKLQSEIDEVYKVCNGEPTYEAINSMVYLSAVISEALRFQTGQGFLDRVCCKDFELPPALPGEKPVLLKPGDVMWIPVYSLHLDPKYFPNPRTFDPERFINGSKVNSTHPAFFPFGNGPRICIANRFALLEIKVVLFHLLQKFNLRPAKTMILPLKMKVRSIVIEPEGGYWLDIIRRTKEDQDKSIANDEN